MVPAKQDIGGKVEEIGCGCMVLGFLMTTLVGAITILWALVVGI